MFHLYFKYQISAFVLTVYNGYFILNYIYANWQSIYYIYILIAIALDESIFLDVLHFPMKNIKSRDL